MGSKSYRVQISDENKAKLDDLAISFGCIYNHKPSLSELLGLIAKGELTLAAKDFSPQQSRRVEAGVLMTLKVPLKPSGIAVAVSKEIAASQGNMFGISIQKMDKSLALMRICLSIVQNNRLSKEDSLQQETKEISLLLRRLNSLTFANIDRFNSGVDLGVNEAYYREMYGILSEMGRIPGDSALPSDTVIKLVKSQEFIFDIECIVRIKVKVISNIGALTRIAEKIAERGLSISSISVESVMYREPIESSEEDIKVVDMIVIDLEIFPEVRDGGVGEDREGEEREEKIRRLSDLLKALREMSDVVIAVDRDNFKLMDTVQY